MLDRNSFYPYRTGMSCPKIIPGGSILLSKHCELITDVNEAVKVDWLKSLQLSFWKFPTSFLAILVSQHIVKT